MPRRGPGSNVGTAFDTGVARQHGMPSLPVPTPSLSADAFAVARPARLLALHTAAAQYSRREFAQLGIGVAGSELLQQPARRDSG